MRVREIGIPLYCYYREADLFSLCKPAFTYYSLLSFKYFACKTLNSVPEIIRT